MVNCSNEVEKQMKELIDINSQTALKLQFKKVLLGWKYTRTDKYVVI